MSSFLNVTAMLLAFALYVPLCRSILKGTAKQNLATWGLWAVLDAIAVGSLVAQHGNYLVPAAYTLGSIVTTLCIFRSRNFVWTKLETAVSVLVVVSVIAWLFAGPWYATILSTTGLVLATIPQLFDSYRRPQDMPFRIYIGYSITNLLSLLAGKNWSVEERLYPTSAFILCLVICGLIARKFWLKSLPSAA